MFQTASYSDFQLLVQTAHVRFHGRKWVHTRLSEKNRTQRHTRRNRGIPSLDHSAALCCQRNPFYSAVLLYTYISRFSVNPQHQQKRNIRQSCYHKFCLKPLFIVFFNFLHKRPTFAFTGESGYTLGFRRKIAHNGLHTETGGVSDGGAIITLDTSRTFTNIPGPGVRTAYFAALGSWPGGALEERRKPSGQRCAYACRCPEGAAAPLGRAALFAIW